MVRAGLEPESICAGAGAFHRPAPGHLPGAGPSPTGQTCCKHSEDGSSQMGRALRHLDSSVRESNRLNEDMARGYPRLG